MSILTAAAKAAITAGPKEFTRPCTSRMPKFITDCWAQIALLSSVFTLEPGDLISTGTPPGAAQQSADPRWLRPGDRVSVAVDGLGLVDNEVVAAPETTVIDPLRPWPPSGPSPQGGSR